MLATLSLAHALAGESVTPRSGEMPWIEVREAHVGQDIHCDAAVVLHDNGRVNTVSVTGCEEPWKTASASAVADWRYRGGAQDHSIPLDYPAPIVVRREDQPISLDEAARIYTPLHIVANKFDLSSPEARRRTRCDVEFFVDGYGLTYALDLTRCPENVRVLAEHRLMRYRFEPESVEGRGLVPVRFRTHVAIR